MTLSATDLVHLAQAAGTGGDPQTAAAVALAESGGDPAAVGRNQDGSRDRGLWQINSRWHPEVSDACAFDPGCNARAAFAISDGWTDFSPWTTYTSGAYLRFMPQVATVHQQAPPARSLYGQGVVGETLTSPWFPGAWLVTQGWGPTDYGGEPEGHGYQHWHAGVDVGVACGTVISLPMGLNGTARALDNPGGYGTALVILVDGSNVGILLGHLRQRLVDDGAAVMGGHQLGVSNSTGNSTGCHVHFEVRPQDPKQPTGLGRYGTDVDPSQWLVSGQAGSSAELFAASSATSGLSSAFQAVTSSLIAGAQVLMGALLVAGGLVVAAYGVRGQDAGDLQRDATRTYRRLKERRVRPRPRGAPEPVSTAAESRIRPDLQRRRPPPGVRRAAPPGQRGSGPPRDPLETAARATERRARQREARRRRPLASPRGTAAERQRESVMDDALRQRARNMRRR